MKTILFLLRKEFLQIFRNRVITALIFIMPVIQLLILANAADYEVKNVNLHIVDKDQSVVSRQLISHFAASKNFLLVRQSSSTEQGWRDIQSRQADLVLEIPPDFGRNLYRYSKAGLHLNIDAINGVKAGLANSYAQAIILHFNRELRREWLGVTPRTPLEITYSNWFNPTLEYSNFMVPGILVLLVTLVGMFLSGMNIVREKEMGTIEQINVTPIRKYQFIIGKLLPFWIIAMVELAIGLIVGWLVFSIPFEGSLLVVFSFAAIYLLVVLGMGLLVSTLTDTQQQAMFISWFFLIIFILMSGLFTPIESMPDWAQKITWFNPVAYFVELMRLVLLKGSSWEDIRPHLSAMVLFALAVNGLAVWNYRKTN